MSATTAPAEHTCHGRIFCGTPRTLAVAECPACNPEQAALDAAYAKGIWEFVYTDVTKA